jgi:hypothetical protein
MLVASCSEGNETSANCALGRGGLDMGCNKENRNYGYNGTTQQTHISTVSVAMHFISPTYFGRSCDRHRQYKQYPYTGTRLLLKPPDITGAILSVSFTILHI